MEDIHPIKPIIGVSLFTENQVLLFWGAVALSFGVILAFLWWKTHEYYIAKKLVGNFKNHNLNDYRTKALMELDEVRFKIEKKEFKSYYLKITRIIKNYLSYRYKTKLIKLTTKETMKKCDFSPMMKDLVYLFLQRVDQAKFANENLKVPSAEAVYVVAKQIINCTK